MKRSITSKKESGAAGRKRRMLEEQEDKKSSNFLMTFLDKTKTKCAVSTMDSAMTQSSVSCLNLSESEDEFSSNVSESDEKDKSVPNKLDESETTRPTVAENAKSTIQDEETIDEPVISSEVLSVSTIPFGEIDVIKKSQSVIPDVIKQHDIGLLQFDKDTGKPILSDSLRIQIIKLSWKYFQNSEGPFLPTNNRSMNKSWFKRTLGNGRGEVVTRSWLAYSPSKKSAFCLCCLLFSHSDHRSTLEQESGFSQWKSFERIRVHENAKNHRECFTKWKEMERNLAANDGIIDAELQSQIEREKQKWRDVLKRILHCIKYLAAQNLALRGHKESLQSDDDSNTGNFLGLVKLLALYDPVMAEHIATAEKHPGSTTYLSPSVQNEFIDLMASTVRESLLERIRKAKYFGLMFDSTPDRGHREQLSEIVRYVDVDFEKKTVRVRESFLGFLQISLKNAESLAETIVQQLGKDKMELKDCRSQCYDNAAVMAGINTGVQQRIREKNNLAMFVNCDNHSLNLVGVHAAKQEVSMVTFFGTIEALYVFFSASTTRWEKLKNAVPAVLKSDSLTRWSARVEAVKPINNFLDKILEVLQNMTDNPNETSDTRSDARQLYTRMLTYDFLILLGFWNKVLIKIDRVQKRLQDPKINFHDAALDLKALQNYFLDEREVLITESLEKGLNLCQEWDVPIERRLRRKKKMAGESSDCVTLTAKQEIERVMKATVDRLCSEMNGRFTRLQDTDEKFGFLLDIEGLCYNVDTKIIKTKCTNFATFYSSDVDGEQLYEEIIDCRMLLSVRSNIKISRPEELLQFIVEYGDESVFPNVRIALQIMLTIAVSIASCERSFSKLKLILSYLRASMGQERLCDLALLSVEREETEKIDFDSVIDEFASVKSRKVHF